MSAGKYTARVPATDNSGGPSNQVTTGVEAIANTAPDRRLWAQPSAGTAPLPVTFTDQSKDSDGQVMAVRWDFGDGVTSTERNPMHLSPAPGEFVVTTDGRPDDNGATAQRRPARCRSGQK